MSEEKYFLTRSGYQRLERELQFLREMQAGEIEQVAEAFDDTDFGENAAYYDAVTDKDRMAARIAHLEWVLARAQVVEGDSDPEHVTPGNRVTVWDPEEKEEIIFDIISSEEVAYGVKGISTESPVGKALLGHQVGDTVEVKVPAGVVRYQVRKIEINSG